MTVQVPPQVRGWCPGALRPMESGDGLIVRVRPRAGAFSFEELRILANGAKLFGNGLIDVTRRGNIQLRGVTIATLPHLWTELQAHGLLDEAPEAEAVRNVLVSPLAGLDPDETLDVRSIAGALEDVLVADRRLWALPTKFSFVVDGGGRVSLDGERADIRLKAMRVAGTVRVALAIDRAGVPGWLGNVPVQVAAGAAVQLALTFLRFAGAHGRNRMRDLPAAAERDFQGAISGFIETSGAPDAAVAGQPPLGPIGDPDRIFAIGLAAPFGRIEADILAELAAVALELGISDVRVSPWRSLYIATEGAAAHAVLACAVSLGFIVNPADPRLKIDVCPGAPACRATLLDTRAFARELAPQLAGSPVHSVHVSGCAKGCARSAPADLVLIGDGPRFGIVRGGTAQNPPESWTTPAQLRDALASNAGALHHV